MVMVAETGQDPNFDNYFAAVEAEEEFQAELERQFGSKATEMRYVWPKDAYDERTRAAYVKKVKADESAFG